MKTSRIVVGMDYAWNGWLNKNFPRAKESPCFVRRKRGTFEIWKIRLDGDLDTLILEKE